MPHLVLGGRRLRVAGDDLAVPACCAFSLRSAWTVVLCVVLGVAHGAISRCDADWSVWLYLVASLCVSVLSMLVEGCLLHDTLQGTIVQMEVRQRMPLWIVAHGVLAVLQLACAVDGILVLSGVIDCPSDVSAGAVRTLLALVVATQISDFMGHVCCGSLVAGKAEGSSSTVALEKYLGEEDPQVAALDTDQSNADRREGLHMAWNNRCRTWCHRLQCLTCNLFGGGDAAAADFEMVARLLVNFFYHEGTLDLAPSDLVAGIILLRHQQHLAARQRVAAGAAADEEAVVSSEPTQHSLGSAAASTGGSPATSAALSSARGHTRFASESVEPYPMPQNGGEGRRGGGGRGELDAGDESDSVNETLIVEGARFSRHALAIYTWMIFVYMNPCTGFRLCCLGSCCGSDNVAFDSSSSLVPDPATASDTGGADGTDAGAELDAAGVQLHRDEESQALSAVQQKRPETEDSVGDTTSPSPATAATAGLPTTYGTILGDNACRWHQAALLEIAQLHNCDLVFADFNNTVRTKPYAVLIDHEAQAVVVTVRGTLSLEDCVTDATGVPADIASQGGARWGVGSGFVPNGTAHQGILESALWVRQDLHRRGILHSIYSGHWPSTDSLENSSDSGDGKRTPLSEPRNVSQYPLVVAGHSLGAGIAAILTILLRAEYPGVRGFAYGVPGGLVDETTARACKDYVTSYILGNDLIPRASLQNMEVLRDGVLDLISRCRVNKHRVGSSIVQNNEDVLSELVYPEDETPVSPFRTQVQQYREFLQRRTEQYGDRLLPPGTLVYLRKVVDERQWCCGRRMEYAPEIAENDYFDSIRVSRTMISDHLPDRYTDILEALVNAHACDSS